MNTPKITIKKSFIQPKIPVKGCNCAVAKCTKINMVNAAKKGKVKGFICLEKLRPRERAPITMFPIGRSIAPANLAIKKIYNPYGAVNHNNGSSNNKDAADILV
jgi:hypothetical protein